MRKLIKFSFFLLLIGVFFAVIGRLIASIPVGERIAIIRIKGAIVEPDRIVAKIEQAEKDQSVKALVLRVDSPGGSVGASQEIFRALEKLKKSGKPLVVSMGNVAASGGYYISAPADFIFANPGTITGSIGVIIQHTDLQELFGKIGIKTNTIKTGEFKDTLSPFKDLSERERQYLQGTVEEVYEQFLKAIMKYRSKKISEEKLRSIADGRVLTGESALKIGLVDGLGNLQDAVEKARALSSAPRARVFYLEDKKGFLKTLLEERFDGVYQYPLMVYYLLR
ncbi:MAG: signal peptide peptidase SppA [Aquificaceae bacterium]|nr:signal peptide peptidase SppA [Aquificaceae bacterium]MDW8237218.1 signal peptide peptidase SppA [Aquificaceae bacterium]